MPIQKRLGAGLLSCLLGAAIVVCSPGFAVDDDARLFRPVQQYGLGHGVYAVAITPDGATLFSTSVAGVLAQDVSTGELIRHYQSTVEGPYLSIEVSSDGSFFVTCSANQGVEKWDIDSGDVETIFQADGALGGMREVELSPDDSKVFFERYDTHQRILWDLEENREVWTVDGAGYTLLCADFSHDGSTIVTCEENDLTLRDVLTGQEIRKFVGDSPTPLDVEFSPDDSKIAAAYYDGTLRTWNVATGALEKYLYYEETPYPGAYNCSVAYSPDGSRLLSGYNYGIWVMWDVETGEVLYANENTINGVCATEFSPDGEQFITGQSWNDYSPRFWSTETGELLRDTNLHTSKFFSIAVTPDGSKLLAGNIAGRVYVWEAETGRRLHTIEGHEHMHTIKHIDISSDGVWFVTGSADRTAKVWNTESWELLRTLDQHSGSVNDVAISHDNTMIATASDDMTTLVWDATTTRVLKTFTGHTDNVTCAAFSMDDAYLLTGSSDKTAILWDIATTSPLHTFGPFDGGVEDVAFSPDGVHLATYSTSAGDLKIWDISTRQLLWEKDSYSYFYQAIDYSPDGKWIISVGSSLDQVPIIIFDAVTGDVIATPDSFSNSIYTVTFDPTGNSFYVGGGIGVIERYQGFPIRSGWAAF